MDTLLQVLLFGGLIFLMMRFGCGAHMFGHGSGHKHGSGHNKENHPGGGGCCGGGGKRAKAPAEAEPVRWSAPRKDTDPVCGRTVFTDNAKSSVHDGQVYYFCSTDCREKFEAGPHLHLKEEGNSAPHPSSALEHRPEGGGSHA